MSQSTTRRQFLAVSASVTSAMGIAHLTGLKLNAADEKPLYEISLAQWSLHKTLFDGKLDNLDFAKTAKEKFGINAVEYVNQFFKDKAKDMAYLGEMKKRASDLGVANVLIMIDGEGN